MSEVRSGVQPGVRSMTGFAAVQGVLGDGAAFTLSLKSVNHRFLDLQLRLPGGTEALEMAMRGLLKARVERGHVEVTLELGRAAAGGFEIDEAALAEVVGSVRRVAGRLGLTAEPDVAALLRLPGVLRSEVRGARELGAEAQAAVLEAMDAALRELTAARALEGETLAAELRGGMKRLREASDAVSRLRGGVREAQFARLRARLEELLAGSAPDPARLMTEAALLAERGDVEEEAVRLRTHAERFVAILDAGGAVGKRLDFLLQEMNREANTTLAKTGSSAGRDGMEITELGLVMKSEIERAREQVQNLE